MRQLLFRLCHNNDIRTTTISIAKSSDTAVMIYFVTTVSKVSVFGDILVSIFPHSDWIRTRITPNTDNFYAAFLTLNKCRSAFSALPNIYDGSLYSNSPRLSAINYFCQKFHLRCLTELWIHVKKFFTCIAP